MSLHEEVYEVAKKYLRGVHRSGPENISACCPFHTSDNPEGSRTFSMSLTRGVYWCFSCQSSGRMEQFLQGMGLSPAIIEYEYKYLIERLHEVPRPRKDPLGADPLRNDLIPENILGIFEFCPTYLREAGFEESTLKYFDVGFDYQHNMTTFPLRDIEGGLIGISGRSMDPNVKTNKYKVYTSEYTEWGLPVSKIDKGTILWNAHRALAVCATTDSPLILVEGFKACMWVHQCGFPNVVALLGNYVTDDQKWIIERITNRIIFMLDGNTPGREGTLKNGRRLQSSKHIKVAHVPEDQQPDDLQIETVKNNITNATVFQLWSSRQRRSEKWWLQKTIELWEKGRR